MRKERGENGLCSLAWAWRLPGLVTWAVLFFIPIDERRTIPCHEGNWSWEWVSLVSGRTKSHTKMFLIENRIAWYWCMLALHLRELSKLGCEWFFWEVVIVLWGSVYFLYTDCLDHWDDILAPFSLPYSARLVFYMSVKCDQWPRTENLITGKANTSCMQNSSGEAAFWILYYQISLYLEDYYEIIM